MRIALTSIASLALLGGAASATTAIITQPGLTQHLAGLTREQFSALDSWVSTSSPPDCCLRIGSAEWNFGDSSTGYGLETAHVYAASGTYTVSLTVYADDGTSATATTSVVVAPAPSFSGFHKFVAASGNDSPNTGDDSSQPYATLEKAFLEWRNSSRNAWGSISINKGDTISFTGVNDGSTGYATPSSGPLFITTYGTGTPPLISVADKVELHWSDSGSDDSFDHPVYVDGLIIQATTPQNPRSMPPGGVTVLNHPGSQISNCICTNLSLQIDGNDYFSAGGHIAGQTIDSCTVSLAAYSGISVFGGAGHVIIKNVNSSANGIDSTLDHQIYVSGCDHVGIIDTLCDGTGASASYSGLKISTTQHAYFKNVKSKASQVGFDVGANPGQGETDDIIYDNCICDTITYTGWYTNWLDRVSIRNGRVYGGCATAVVKEQSYGLAHRVNRLQIVAMSAYHPGGPLLDCTTSYFVSIIMKNCVCQNAANIGPVVRLAMLADAANVSADGNQWYLDNTTSSYPSLMLLGSTYHSFGQWVSIDGEDANGAYGDPKYNAPASRDLSLQAGSPCVDNGLTLPVVRKDALGVLRPRGFGYDKGALER